MDTRQIAVVNQSDNLTSSDIAKATAAVQKQVASDFAPVWGVSATVSAFPHLEDVPLGSWPVAIRDDIGINEPGVHLGETGKKVFALVLFTGKKWTVTLSHEILEMLADPFGTLFFTGPGDSLSKLLARRLDVYNRHSKQRLTEGIVLAWADSYKARTGAWPTAASGFVPDAPGEMWRRINVALRLGLRGLPGGASLGQLLAARRCQIKRPT